MDRILIILKKENGPRASSAPALGLNSIIFKHVYWYMQQTQVSVYRTIGPLVDVYTKKKYIRMGITILIFLGWYVIVYMIGNPVKYTTPNEKFEYSYPLILWL